METASQFAARCIGLTEYPHPTGNTGASPTCWLCGGDTDGKGWPLRDAITSTFTNHNRAACPSSDAVCWQCVATSSSTGWSRHCELHPDWGISPYFPQKEGKNPRAMNWLYFSHLFRDGWHETPSRARWREILLEPPEPPFLAVLTTAGQKHLIFRSRIARSREMFWLQFEEEPVWFQVALFRPVLEQFERLYALGFSRDAIRDGQYHHGQLIKVDRAAWLKAEGFMRFYRRQRSQYVRIAHFVAQREEPAQ